MSNKLMSVKNKLRLQFLHNVSGFFETYPFKGSSRLRNLLIRLLAPTPKGGTIVRTRYGFDIIVDPVADIGGEREIYYSGAYESGTLDVIKKCLREGDTFIDVGAHIGLMSLFASQLVGERGMVYSFEPSSDTCGILQRNIKLNAINNVHVCNFALGSKRNTAILYKNRDNRGSTSLIFFEDSDREEILIQSLDGFAMENDLQGLRMVKIDVEGWELEVLKGSKRLLGAPVAPIICIEYSNLHPQKNGRLVDVYDFILSVNEYRLYKLERGKAVKSRLIRISNPEDLPYHDNIFGFLPTHLESLRPQLRVW